MQVMHFYNSTPTSNKLLLILRLSNPTRKHGFLQSSLIQIIRSPWNIEVQIIYALLAKNHRCVWGRGWGFLPPKLVKFFNPPPTWTSVKRTRSKIFGKSLFFDTFSTFLVSTPQVGPNFLRSCRFLKIFDFPPNRKNFDFHPTRKNFDFHPTLTGRTKHTYCLRQEPNYKKLHCADLLFYQQNTFCTLNHHKSKR